MSDHYTVLGVSALATPSQLSSAYRARALQLHPDKADKSLSDQQRATRAEEFNQLQHAYQVLSHGDTRAQYDVALKAGGLLARFTSASGSGSGGVLHCTDIDLEECEYEENTATYTYPCRCGAEYRMAESLLMETGLDLFPCAQCSLVVRVTFEGQVTQGQHPAGEEPDVSASLAAATASAVAVSSSCSVDPNAMG